MWDFIFDAPLIEALSLEGLFNQEPEWLRVGKRVSPRRRSKPCRPGPLLAAFALVLLGQALLGGPHVILSAEVTIPWVPSKLGLNTLEEHQCSQIPPHVPSVIPTSNPWHTPTLCPSQTLHHPVDLLVHTSLYTFVPDSLITFNDHFWISPFFSLNLLHNPNQIITTHFLFLSPVFALSHSSLILVVFLPSLPFRLWVLWEQWIISPLCPFRNYHI